MKQPCTDIKPQAAQDCQSEKTETHEESIIFTPALHLGRDSQMQQRKVELKQNILVSLTGEGWEQSSRLWKQLRFAWQFAKKEEAMERGTPEYVFLV